MANGDILGGVAEAFSRNINAALRFRQARAEQQFQQGLALERKELATERVDLERRRIEISQEEVQRGITQRETLEKEIEDLLTTATGPRGQVAENITKTPQFRRKAIRLKAKGVDVDKLLGIEEDPKLTQTQQFWEDYWNPNTSVAKKDKLSIILFGKPDRTATVDGVPTVDVRRILDTLHPVLRFGGREAVPEGIDPNSYEFLIYGARLAKGILGESEVGGIDPRIEVGREKGFIIAE